MGVRILSDIRQDYSNISHANLYCSTSDWAFGPVFYGDDEHDAHERAEAFCRWLGDREPRRMSDSELETVYHEWSLQEAAQWAAEDAAVNGDDDNYETPA
jgi:hypothetical protein